MDFSNIPEGHEDGEEPLVFYYNREERLKHAPQNVRDYYEGKIVAFKPGLFKALVATKANRFILFALVVCFLLVLFLGFFGPKQNVETYKGIPINLKAFYYDGKVLVNVKIDDAEKKYREDYISGLPVSVRFIPYDADNNVIPLVDSLVIYRQTYEGKKLVINESFDDFDIDSIYAEVELLDRVSDNKINLKTKVER